MQAQAQAQVRLTPRTCQTQSPCQTHAQVLDQILPEAQAKRQVQHQIKPHAQFQDQAQAEVHVREGSESGCQFQVYFRCKLKVCFKFRSRRRPRHTHRTMSKLSQVESQESLFQVETQVQAHT